MKKLFVLSVVCLAFLIGSSVANARDYNEELRRCLVQSASSKDTVILALWSGLAMTQHTAVASMVTISEKEFLKITEEAANVYLRLAGEMCLNETFNALKYEGPNSLNNGFDYLAEVRWPENYSDAGARKAIGLFNAYTEDTLYSTLGTLLGSSVDKASNYGKDYERNCENELKKCLIQSASSKDKTILALWSGLIMTQHTAVAPMVSISEKDFLKITKEAGNVYLRLTCEMCLNETFNAVKHESGNALGDSFTWLEEVSKAENDSDAGVRKALKLFHAYTAEKLLNLLEQWAKSNEGKD